MENKKAGVMACMRGMLRFMKPYRGKAVLALLMVVVSQLTFALNPSVEGLITSQLSDDAVDIINGVSGAHVHFDIILKIMLVLLGLYLLKTVSQLITAFCLTDAIQGTMHDLRNALQQKIQRLPERYFDDQPFGDVLSRVTNDLDKVSEILQTGLLRLMISSVSITGSIAMMFYFNWLLALIFLAIMAVCMVITKIVASKNLAFAAKRQASFGKLTGLVEEY